MYFGQRSFSSEDFIQQLFLLFLTCENLALIFKIVIFIISLVWALFKIL